MSKKNKKQNVNVENTEVVEVIENKEDTEMTEKKGFINTIKEFGSKVPKPVKVIVGGLAAAGAVAGTALVVISKFRNGEDADLDESMDYEDSEVETTDEAETEAPVEE